MRAEPHRDSDDGRTGGAPRALVGAFAANYVWINASEVWRYFAIVRPMLRAAYPDDPGVGAMNLAIFAVWGVWATILIAAATGFFWLYLQARGATLAEAAFGATGFTLGTFGLLWLGGGNMGLAPAPIMWTALPLAWLELFVAALIVRRFMRRARSTP
ncbi:MAG: hypothetical protein ACFB00_12140 [Parvularculaceae bacterium]